jgi:hypothetical protein
MEWRISESFMNSSALCERAELPGPNFKEGKGIKAWSLSVGEP